MLQHTSEKTEHECLSILKEKFQQVPRAAVVAGSGVNVLDNLVDEQSINYIDLFGATTSVAGHAGSLTIGWLKDKRKAPIAVLHGRFHLYEGHGWSIVTLPMRTLISWGVSQIFLTNAAGGMNQSFSDGDLMLIKGYRDFLHPKWRELGLLPALAEPVRSCENELTNTVIAAVKKLEQEKAIDLRMRQGVYCGVTGPSYETMAEIEMYGQLGDAIGMSTVPELEAVANASTKAAAISVITNVWRKDQPIGGHEEVLAVSKAASQRLDQLLRALLL